MAEQETEVVTVTVRWVAPAGTLETLRARGDAQVAAAAARAVVLEPGTVLFVNATSEAV